MTNERSPISLPPGYPLSRIEAAGILALLRAHSIIQNLGEKGIAYGVTNRFGEQGLVGDVKAEEAVLTTLQELHIPIAVHSEEHGLQYIYSSSPEKDSSDQSLFTGTLDGIDGSRQYISDWKHAKSGTLLSMYAGTDPTYDDYLFSGFMIHSQNILYYAVKGFGTSALDTTTLRRKEVHISSKRQKKN